jgi:hypothetical protein
MTPDAVLAAAAEAAPLLADTQPAERRRFLHAVADALDAAGDERVPIALPAVLRDADPAGLTRRVDGVRAPAPATV